MIATIHITKLQTAVYVMHVDDREQEVVYSSIAEALADHEDIPPEYAKFVNLEYDGVRLATMAVECMRHRSRELAAELVQLSAEVYDSQ